MAFDNYGRSLDHIAAVRLTRDALDHIHSDPNPRRADVARLNNDLGDALKLAEVHATLAVADELRQLREVIAE